MLPPRPLGRRVIFYFDGDKPGSMAYKQAQKAAHVYSMQQREVFIARAPEGKDWNDMAKLDRETKGRLEVDI